MKANYVPSGHQRDQGFGLSAFTEGAEGEMLEPGRAGLLSLSGASRPSSSALALVLK